jgi:competence protein ComGC
VLALGGSLVVLVFVVQTLIAFFQRTPDSFGFWNWVAAGETAAWRLKWLSIPVLIVTFWLGRKLYRSILLQPGRFCGVTYARNGLVASATVVMLIGLLIGITVPARLEHHKLANDAAFRAHGYVLDRAFTEYKIKYKTYPAELNDLLERLPDPDGSLAAAISTLDPSAYRPSADVAAVTAEKSRRLRGAVIRNASLSSATDDTPAGGLSFTNYVLRLPGEDKITGNDDDWVVRDGMVMRLVFRSLPQKNRRRSLTNRTSVKNGPHGRRAHHRRRVR